MLGRALVALLALLLLLGSPAMPAAAQGGLDLTATHQSIVVDGSDTVTLSLRLHNGGEEGQAADVVVARAPEGWTTALKSGGFIVRRIYVNPEERELITLQVTPPSRPEPGTYEFVVEARDGARVLSRLDLAITVEPGAPGSIALTGDFPVLTGSAGQTFEYKLTVRNDTNEEQDVALSAAAPQGWRVSFKPAFENKQISSVRLEGGTSKSLDVEVTAPEAAEPGEYNVVVAAQAGTDQAISELRTSIVGSYELELTTPTGRLNAAATAGQERTVNIVLVNRGSAEIVDLSLSARAPQGWETEFAPERVDVLPAQSVREVQLKIRPSAKAIAGDYVVNVSAGSPFTSASQQLRVTVETPPTLGIVGAVVIAAVLGVLLWLFGKYGRR